MTYATHFICRQAAALVLAALVGATLWLVTDAPTRAARPSNTPPSGDTVSGTARVIDGDTIDINGVRIRLEGIDAPEIGQACPRAWVGTWPCGQDAANHLDRLVRDREVSCVSRGHDLYGRMLGECVTAGLTINANMVRTGMAWAFVRYSSHYIEDEAEARDLKLGIWQANAQPAWEYRANRWAGESGKAPDGCAIKGKITRAGHVYHMPWSPWYAKAHIDLARGERWFCNESEAIAAGWRPAGYR